MGDETHTKYGFGTQDLNDQALVDNAARIKIAAMQRKSYLVGIAVLVLLGPLVIYPASIGPVYGLCVYFDIYQPTFGWFESFYEPLALIPDEPLGDWIDDWIWFCRGVAKDAKD